MAKLTGDIIKAGLHVWVGGYINGVLSPVEVIIRDGQVNHSDEIQTIVVDLAVPTTEYVGVSRIAGTQKLGIYLGDAGVRPYNYDNRCTQVFTTQEEMQAAIDLWDDDNPNFLDEDGDPLTLQVFDRDYEFEEYQEEN